MQPYYYEFKTSGDRETTFVDLSRLSALHVAKDSYLPVRGVLSISYYGRSEFHYFDSYEEARGIYWDIKRLLYSKANQPQPGKEIE